MKWIVLLFSIYFFPCSTLAFYFPGALRNSYEKGQVIPFKVVKATSVKTQLPYDYYYLPFCRPKDQEKKISYYGESLGQVLLGDRIADAPFSIRMFEPVKCKIYCKKSLTMPEMKILSKSISDEYRAQLQLDGLPGVRIFDESEGSGGESFTLGYLIGKTLKGQQFVNNFLEIEIFYHEEEDEKKAGDLMGAKNDETFAARGKKRFTIVGFEVKSVSLNSRMLEEDAERRGEGGENACKIPAEAKEGHNLGIDNVVHFGYSVEFHASKIRWNSRWDRILESHEARIHWFAIMNSLVIVLFLSAVVAMIIVRTLRKDIARYNEEDTEEAMEESGWKLLHGDIFRPPEFLHLFVCFVGSGLHLFLMTFLTVFFAMSGFLSPSRSGSLVNGATAMYVLLGAVSGYFSGRLYRSLRGKSWMKASFWMATFLPGFLLLIIVVVNFFVWSRHSSKAIPFTTLIAIFCLLFFLNVPLVSFGFFFGYRKKPYEFPVRMNQIPRQVPPLPWYLSGVSPMFLTGILPFGAVFIELHYIFQALWTHQIYYLF
eukprot:Sdes_comp22324_c0_seq1m20803